MAGSGGGDARIGADVIEAVIGGIVLGGVRLIGNGHVQLAVEVIEQVLVGAEVGDVVTEVVEQRGDSRPSFARRTTERSQIPASGGCPSQSRPARRVRGSRSRRWYHRA